MITGLSTDNSGQTRFIRADTHGAYVFKNNRWEQVVTSRSMPVDDRIPERFAEGAEAVAASPPNAQRLFMAAAAQAHKVIQGRMFRADIVFNRTISVGDSIADVDQFRPRVYIAMVAA